MSVERGYTYSDAGATALDNKEGDMTSKIVTVNPVDTSIVGSYATYNLADSAGNIANEVSRTVEVTPDVTLPVITLLGDATLSVARGASYLIGSNSLR